MSVLNELSGGLAQLAEAPAWATLLLKATVLLAAAWLIHWTLARANPRWRVLLWRGTAVGLVALPVLGLVLPGIEMRVARPETAPVTASLPAGPVAAAGEIMAPPYTELPIAVEAGDVESKTEDAAAMPQAQPSAAEAKPSIGTPTIAARRGWILPAIWLGGFALLAVRLGIGYCRIRRLVRSCRPASAEVIDQCRRVAKTLACRPGLRVRRCSAISAPLLCGLRRPLLLLPSRMCEPAYRDELPAILAHESAHVRSSDCLWNAGLHLVSMVLWFHPLCWPLRRAHQAACDAACDGVAAGFVGDTKAYCRTLARVALSVARPPAVGMAMARAADITRRLNALRRRVFHEPLRRRGVAAFALGGAFGLVLIGGLHLAYAQPSPKVKAGSETPCETPAAEKKAADATAEGEMRVRIVDRSGKPIPGAKVKVLLIKTPSEKQVKSQHRCGRDGVVVVEVPKKTPTVLSLSAAADGYVPMRAWWQNFEDRKDPIPPEFTFTLEKGVPIGGVVHNEQGGAIEGARVHVSGPFEGLRVMAEFARRSGDAATFSAAGTTGKSRAFMGTRTEQTDAEGKWRCNVLRKDLKGLVIALQHEDYLEEMVHHGDSRVAKLLEPLEQGKAVLVMKKGIMIQGTITDPQRSPVAGARVVADDSRYVDWSYREGAVAVYADVYSSIGAHASATGVPETDRQGHYRLPGRRPGRLTLWVSAPGLAVDMRRVNVEPGMGPVDIQLKKGRPLRIRVVDRDGKPVAGASVRPMIWQGPSSLSGLGVPKQTDEEGRWSWDGAPADEITFFFSKRGYMNVVDKLLRADGEEHLITLPPPLTVSGRVVDAATKAPIESFRVIPGIHMGEKHGVYWEPSSRAIDGKQGKYRARFFEPRQIRLIKIEAAGYRPAVSRKVRSDEGEPAIDFELHKSPQVIGMVRLPDGKPAAGAKVVLCPQSVGVDVVGGKRAWSSQTVTAETAADGRFTLPPQAEPYTLLVLDSRGFAEVAQKEFAASKQITILPWARVEGSVRIGDRPGANQSLSLHFLPSARPGARLIQFYDHTRSDAEGKFVFRRVIPGTGYVYRLVNTSGPQWVSSQGVEVKLSAGRTTKVRIGGTGRPVVGRAVVPAKENETIDFTSAGAELSRKPPQVPLPRDYEQVDPDTRKAWYERWRKSPEGKRYQRRGFARYACRIAADGSFRFDDIPAGVYELEIAVAASPGSTPRRERFWSASREVTVPDVPGGRSDEPLKVGSMKLALRERPVPEAGAGVLQFMYTAEVADDEREDP